MKIKFIGIDGHNRPIFKSVEKWRGQWFFYGSCDTLFADDATEKEVLAKITPLDLCYFGGYFGCEPLGTSVPDLEII